MQSLHNLKRKQLIASGWVPDLETYVKGPSGTVVTLKYRPNAMHIWIGARDTINYIKRGTTDMSDACEIITQAFVFERKPKLRPRTWSDLKRSDYPEIKAR